MLPQLIYLGLSLLGLGIAIEQHGKPKKGNENFWITFITWILTLGLLYWGGFFDVFK